MTPAEKTAHKKPKKTSVNGRVITWVCTMRRMRLALGLTIRDVEKGTGISNAAVSQIERGCDLNLTTAAALSEFFGESINYIWPERIK